MPSVEPKDGRHPKRLGKYEIVNHIASGGMGSVYKAVDTKLGRPVALKVLPAELAANPVMIERFHREAKSAARFTHENIVTLLDDGEFEGTHFLVMEFIDGVDLGHFIERKGKLDPEEARRILIQAARALDHAHQQGVVHRDIKPANFLLTKKDGKLLVKLTDMGLARKVNEKEFRVTRDGTTVGTIDYISPEQAHDSSIADTRSDIYSLGCTFFHMLAGNPPFSKGSLPERLMHHLKTQPPDIRTLSDNVPASFAHILKHMLAKKPSERYQTPRELLKDLENPDKISTADDGERLATLQDLAASELEDSRPARASGKRERAEEAEARASRRKKKLEQETQEEEAAQEEESEHDDSAAEHDAWSAPWWAWAIAGLAGIILLVVIWQIVKLPRD